jgi:hypothetical protein
MRIVGPYPAPGAGQQQRRPSKQDGQDRLEDQPLPVRALRQRHEGQARAQPRDERPDGPPAPPQREQARDDKRAGTAANVSEYRCQAVSRGSPAAQ